MDLYKWEVTAAKYVFTKYVNGKRRDKALVRGDVFEAHEYEVPLGFRDLLSRGEKVVIDVPIEKDPEQTKDDKQATDTTENANKVESVAKENEQKKDEKDVVKKRPYSKKTD